eukprot:jgi/Astpho2/3906/Aster-x1183
MLEPTPFKKLRASPHSASSNNSCAVAVAAVRCWCASPSAVLPLPLPPGQRDQCLPLDVLLCHEDEDVAMLLGSPFEELSGGSKLQAEEASEMGLSCSPCPGLESETSGLSDVSIDPCECTQSTPSTQPGLFVCRFLSKASLISQLAATYKFSDYSVAVGTTYFQRLAARDPAMRYYALQSAEFSQHLTGVPADAGRDSLWRSVGYGHTFRLTHDGWLTLLHMTCIYLAAKNVEFVPYRNLLKTMMSRIYASPVPKEWVSELELECLDALEWRLGPFFRHTV